jgi:hypothetical protein
VSRLSIRPFTTEQVTKGLKALVPSSGEGEVGIETIILVECADEIGKVITLLFNLIIITGIYPDDWKCAHITPIYKNKGSKSSLDSYRPISILAPISKLFEKLLAEQITDYLESNNLLNPAQFGFRKSLSCELALNTLVETLRNALDDGDDAMVVMLDFTKAFDTVDHALLLFKLTYYGFDDKLILLIKNYLTNRTIKVKVNDAISHSKTINIGVPQGSVLGPLLFIIFINDMCLLKLNSKIMLFADDTTISARGPNPEFIITLLEEDLKLITEWLQHNKLILNVSKSQAMCFNSNQKLLLKTQENRLKLSIRCDKHSISLSKQVKLLGVVLDNKLSFGPQTAALVNKVNNKTALLKKSLFLFTPHFRPILYKIFIQSLFDYCSTLTTHLTNKAYEKRLDLCYSRSIFTLLKIKIKNISLEEQYEALIKINILPLRLRRFFRLCTFIFTTCKILNSPFGNFIFFYKNNLSTRSHFKSPIYYKSFKEFSLTSISIKLLNEFIFDHISIGSLSIFKKFLYTDLIKLYNSSEKFFI